MPVYDFICRKCGNKFQANCGLTDLESEIKCPACGTKNPDRDRSKFFPGQSGDSTQGGFTT